MVSGRLYKLVFLLEDSDYSQDGIRREVARAPDPVTTKGLLNFRDSPPTIRIGRSSYHVWECFDVE